MKILDVSSVTDSSQMPVKSGTLEFIQLSYREVVAAMMQALIGPGYDPAVVYILYGVVDSGTLPVYNISAGMAFYNGEVFPVDAASFSAAGANVAVFQQVQTQFTTDADPVTFSDSAVRNIHNIRKLQIVQGATGSGIADFMQLFRLNFTIPQQLQLTKIITGDYSDNVLEIIGSYPTLSLYVPAPPSSVNPILFAGSFNVGDPNVGGYDITFPSPLATSNYYVMGSIISNGVDAAIDSSLGWSIRNRTTDGFKLTVKEFAAGVQNVAFEYIIFAK